MNEYDEKHRRLVSSEVKRFKIGDRTLDLRVNHFKVGLFFQQRFETLPKDTVIIRDENTYAQCVLSPPSAR